MSSCPGRILLAYIYEYSHLKPVQVGVVKEQINQAEEKKGKNGDVHLKVDICCVACIRKVRRVLIELNGDRRRGCEAGGLSESHGQNSEACFAVG